MKHWCEEHWTMFTLSNISLWSDRHMSPNVIKEHFKSTWLQEYFSEIEGPTKKKKIHFIFKVSNKDICNWKIKIINNYVEHKMSECQGLLKKELGQLCFKTSSIFFM